MGYTIGLRPDVGVAAKMALRPVKLFDSKEPEQSTNGACSLAVFFDSCTT